MDRPAWIVRQVENGYIIYDQNPDVMEPSKCWVALSLVDVHKILQEFVREKKE